MSTPKEQIFNRKFNEEKFRNDTYKKTGAILFVSDKSFFIYGDEFKTLSQVAEKVGLNLDDYLNMSREEKIEQVLLAAEAVDETEAGSYGRECVWPPVISLVEFLADGNTLDQFYDEEYYDPSFHQYDPFSAASHKAKELGL